MLLLAHLNCVDCRLVYLFPMSSSAMTLYLLTKPSCKLEQLISRPLPLNSSSLLKRRLQLQTVDFLLSIDHTLLLLIRTYCLPVIIMPAYIDLKPLNKDLGK
jgi:hypothetical protein